LREGGIRKLDICKNVKIIDLRKGGLKFDTALGKKNRGRRAIEFD